MSRFRFAANRKRCRRCGGEILLRDVELDSGGRRWLPVEPEPRYLRPDPAGPVRAFATDRWDAVRAAEVRGTLASAGEGTVVVHLPHRCAAEKR